MVRARRRPPAHCVRRGVVDGPDHESWGGVVTPEENDSMAAYVEAIFPTLPTATVVQLDWYPTYRYTTLDYLVRQFSYDLLRARRGLRAFVGAPLDAATALRPLKGHHCHVAARPVCRGRL